MHGIVAKRLEANLLIADGLLLQHNSNCNQFNFYHGLNLQLKCSIENKSLSLSCFQ